MREIKFRAWDKCNNKWIHQDLFFLSNNGFYPDYRCLEDGISLFDFEFELMQYTGLKDKNGKEIYEGDIVNIYGGEYSQGFYEVDVKGVVVYSGASYFLKDKEDVHHPIDMICDSCGYPNFSVFGNIYENPELLEESK